MRIVYKLPSRSRPTKFFGCLDNILAMIRHDDFLIIPTLDDNDHTINELVKNKLSEYGPRVQPVFGRSTSKINAVNRGMPAGPWDIVVATSDDMEFIKPGFDLDIIENMQRYFPDTDGVLHYPDGHDHGEILSLPVIGRKYYDRCGHIFHPVYTSLCADEEALIVARLLGKCASIKTEIVSHNHPAWGKGKMDAQYKYTEAFYHIDKRIFDNRKRKHFFV